MKDMGWASGLLSTFKVRSVFTWGAPAVVRRGIRLFLAVWIGLLAFSAEAGQRTWYFSQNGRSESDALFSFRKGGRMDAEFIRLEGTNLVVLGMAGQTYAIALTNFSEADQRFVNAVKGLPVDEHQVVQAGRAQAQAIVARQQAEAMAKERERVRKEAELRRDTLRRKAQEVQAAKLKIADLERVIMEGTTRPTWEERKASEAEVAISRQLLTQWQAKLTQLTSEYAKLAVSAEADAKSEAERLLGDGDYRLFLRDTR